MNNTDLNRRADDLPAPQAPARLDPIPKSRNDAIDSGAIRYWTGKPCKNGHIADRYTLNGSCVVCQQNLVNASKAKARAIRAKK